MLISMERVALEEGGTALDVGVASIFEIACRGYSGGGCPRNGPRSVSSPKVQG